MALVHSRIRRVIYAAPSADGAIGTGRRIIQYFSVAMPDTWTDTKVLLTLLWCFGGIFKPCTSIR